MQHNLDMSEKDVAAKLKEKNRSILWKPISDKFGVGTPDRCGKWRKQKGGEFWAELKFIKKLPVRGCKVGLKKKQAGWLEEWKENCGNCVLIVGIESENKVALFFDGFRKISSDGLMREQFDLVAYDEVSGILRKYFS